MKILINGCSFTHWPEYPPDGPNICWPRYFSDLRPGDDIVNIAEPAAGNQYICDSTIRQIMDRRPDHVLIMWSGVSRLDYLTSLEDPSWQKLFSEYGFYRRVPNSNLGWIFSGGKMGTWFGSPVAHTIFNELYKVSSNTSLAWINLMEIIKTQNFLRAQNIPYHFMSYVNYWCTDDHVSRNGDFGVLGNPALKPLIDAIDFEPWIFSNTARDGIFELSKELDDFQPDKFHPGNVASQRWAELITRCMPSAA
jgi:hypothetical protein